MRKLFVILLIALMWGCTSPQKEMKEDAIKLVRMEKQILELTKQSRQDKDPGIVTKRDSLGEELQELSRKFRRKYEDLDQAKQFQEAYQEAKEEVFEN